MSFLKHLVVLYLVALISARSWDYDDEEVYDNLQVIGREIKGNITITGDLEHGFEMPYTDTRFQSNRYIFGGSTVLDLDQHCRLTQPRQAQAGYLWSREPIASSQFQVDVELSIGGHTGPLFGDGLAIWLVEDQVQNTGPVFGAPDHWKGLGIFIDTFPNTKDLKSFPIMMGIFNNGSKTYDVGQDGRGQEDGECSVSRIREEGPHSIRINYVKSKFLEVLVRYTETAYEVDEVWAHCFTIPNITLPSRPYLGFSAHTGKLIDAHDIISITTRRIIFLPEPFKFTDPIQVNPEELEIGSVYVRYLVMVVVVILVFAGGRRYQQRLGRRRF